MRAGQGDRETTDEMIALSGGTFLMGSSAFYRDEAPVVERTVQPFRLDQHLVTNDAFATFVADTAYLTVAESALEAIDYPGVNPADLVPGGLTFRQTAGPVNLGDWQNWWTWTAGASWRHPFGPSSDLTGKGRHPVVQIAFRDAQAYASWCGKRLPTEWEWEYAGRGGSSASAFAWGDDPQKDGRLMANTWQGRFPYSNTGADGWIGTSPVGSFSSNGFGLSDMIGNVWEWTSDYYSVGHWAELPEAAVDDGCRCGPAARSAEPGSTIPRRVLKGGSHLCAPEYCLRYRPAARSPQAEDTATTHIGFRCAL